VVAPVFQYAVHHPVSRAKIGMLDVREASWSETVSGGSTFTGKVTVPDNPITIASIKRMTDPGRAALYVTVPNAARLPWSGPIVANTWNDETNELGITAIDWRSWLYTVILGPKPDGTGTNTFTFTNWDQLGLAREMIRRLQSADFNPQGIPLISDGAYFQAGITRNFQISGMDFKSPAQYIDDIANLDRGFEWDLTSVYHTDGLPIQTLQLYFPQQGGPVEGLRFVKTPNGGNILTLEDVTNDASQAARRVWAVGEGPNAESTPWGSDSDPELAAGTALRSDVASTYRGGLTRADLASYARAERLYRADTLAAVTFNVRMDAPDMFSYGKGDRCRVTIRDRFVDLDAFNCRILSREFSPETNNIKVTVNLNDRVLPEVDTGGSV
jgi:hypothetical protein